MPFKFRHLCELLQSLDDNRIKKKASTLQAKNSNIPIIINWFKKHDGQITRHGPSAVAFLSCVFPERRVDRVYNVQEKRLEKIIGRILMLGSTRMTRLSSWRTGNAADFGQTVQVVMSEAEFDLPRPDYEVTLEEVDTMFDRTAASYCGSSPELQARIVDPIKADQALQSLLPRLQSMEAKWLIRMFLKRYTPVDLPERLVLRQLHCLLPDILRLQNCLIAAVACLTNPLISRLCPRPQNKDQEDGIRLAATPHMRPQIGIMVQRPPHYKARSIQHCVDMAARRRISVERKYDGEYCQIHVDISKGKESIKIFSKSGRDSTSDRVRLHGAIESTLRLGRKDCPVKKQCILEGELLIWNEKKQQIQPFEKIRKHITRNGRFLGNDHDSPRNLHEKVMIMFYDILLYDDIVCLNETLEQRRSRLRSLLRRVPGRAELGYREKINFASSEAKTLIRHAFAKCISRGWEGFVLKGCYDPYFSLAGSPTFIKLKKDYIAGLGDMADLAIIGGRRDAREVQALNIGSLSWTTFYLACIENRDEAQRFSAKPRLRVVGVVSAEKKTISPERVRLLNDLGNFERLPYASNRVEMEVRIDLPIGQPTELFKSPFVVEVVGGGFEKPPKVTYHSLRFPRITKIHHDRSWGDVMSFDELQRLADESLAMAVNEDSQEDCQWIEKLIQAEPKSKFVAESSGSTSAGRKLSSTSTASATPIKSRSYLSPQLVRIDTQEMTEQELHDRALPVRVQVSPDRVPEQSRTSLKRRSDVQDQDPVANRPTKSRKLSPSDDEISINNTSHHQRHPLSPCSAQPQTPVLESSNPLRPLELASASSQAARPSLYEGGNDSSNMTISSVNQLKRNVTEPVTQSKSSPDPLSARTKRKPLEEAPLPTPPTSSSKQRQTESTPLDLQGQARTPSPAQQSEADHHRNIKIKEQLAPSCEPQHKPPSPPHPPTHQQPSFSNPIFLSPDLLHLLPQLSATTNHDLISNLSAAKATFTFSADTFFLNNNNNHHPPNNAPTITTSPHLHLLAIIDIAHAEQAGTKIQAFHQQISHRLQTGELSRSSSGLLVFLDWRILLLLQQAEDGTAALSSHEHLRRHFAGCLAWRWRDDDDDDGGGGGGGGKPQWKVVDLWSWREVLLRLEGVRSSK